MESFRENQKNTCIAMPTSAIILLNKDPMQPGRCAASRGASGASNMPNNKSTGDRYEMRPIDVELREARATKLRIQGVLCQIPKASPRLTSR